MTNPLIKLVNATTGEELEREMNSEELEIYKQEQMISAAVFEEEAAKTRLREAAEAKLLALGLTADDLKALLG